MGYYLNQLKTLVKRNLLLKKASKKSAIMEIALPIYCALMICYIGFLKRFTDGMESQTLSVKDPTELVYLNKYITFDIEKPLLGFVLPDGSDQSIIEKVMDNDIFNNTQIKPIKFKTQNEMIKYGTDMNNKEQLFGGIIFENKDLLKYTIRLDIKNTEDPETSPIPNRDENGLLSGKTDNKYLYSFTPIQTAVDEAIIRLKTKDDSLVMKYFFGKLGNISTENQFVKGISNNAGFFIVLSFASSVYIITLNIVKEKEDKLKDGLLIAGVHPTIFWLSWLIAEGFTMLIISIIMTVIIVINRLFSNVNFTVIFSVIFLFSLSTCTISFIFSTFFKKAKTASVVVLFFYLIPYLIAHLTFHYLNENISRILSLFISPVTFREILQSFDNLRYTSESLSFKNIFKTDTGIFLIIFIGNTIFYFILSIIFDNLLSNENGRYLFMPKRNMNDFSSENEINYQKDIQEDFNARNGEKCMVEVNHVHKIFKRKGVFDIDDNNNNTKQKKNEFLAVNDVSFKVYQNEIFAILGHNGAGKTTLINIMVGLIKATYGDVYFDSSSISKNVNNIRKDFGVCAQTNIIYDELTVEDHINFYANLKNVKVDVDEVLKELDLLPQKKLKSSKLSGGQKRKLCIGMAIIGNPKYIFLDEPTTGLDPLSRRKIWELLLKKKEGRVIFLTTHYMDEADILADRKLILNKGKIRCLGTSLYLKNHFNMKYNLGVETCEKEKINELIMSYLPEATYVEDKEANSYESCNQFYTWRLPLNSSDRFAPLLNELDRLSGSVINKYSLSLPTLEELFIRLEDGIVLQEDKDKDKDNDNNNIESCLIQTNENRLPKLKSVNKPTNTKFIIILVKYRLKIFIKDKVFAFCAVLLPIILFTLIFYFLNKYMFNEGDITYQSKEVTVPTMYFDTKINYETNSTLPLTPANIISGVSNKISEVTNIQIKEMEYPQFNDKYYLSSIDGEFYNTNNTLKFDVFYNNTMPHSVPAIVNALSNAYLASKNINDRITINNQPFDKRQNEKASIGLTLIDLMLGISIVLILNKFGPLSTRERINKLLLQLQLNSVSRFSYWISSLITDNVIFLTTCILLILGGVVVGFEPLQDVKLVLLIIGFLIIWSIPTMLYQYILSFLFKNENSAYLSIMAINICPICIGYVGLIIINLSTNNSMIGKLYGIFPVVFCLALTIFCPAFGIVALLNALFTLKMNSKLLPSSDLTLKMIMNKDNMISLLLILFVVLLFVYYIILMILDRKKNSINKSDIHELPQETRESYEKALEEGDDDVKREYEYIMEHRKDLPISTLHLCKEFNVPKNKIPDKKVRSTTTTTTTTTAIGENQSNYTYGSIHESVVNPNKFVKTAVIDVNFGVRNHECFGLLGPNGAGKTTTLNTIASTIPQTMGSICFHGVEIHQAKLSEISMGYCPQQDILWKELTLREHIEFFLRIRGYHSKDAKVYASHYINAVGLEEHQNKCVDSLSGGTKRKLSIIIAICGYPKRILLDEPTAGMDPSTRRLIWDIIKQTKRMNDSAIILTTHSMEEVEHLCDRLAILVNGRLICIGSPEHLKMKYGESYTLELQTNDIDQFHSEIIKEGNLFNSNQYKMEKISNNRVKYEVKITKYLGSIFEKIEECKKSGLVTDYSFNQTSLEQIFINFAKKQIVQK
jgi:ABC-type multidrug transport system ATPase subunit